MFFVWERDSVVREAERRRKELGFDYKRAREFAKGLRRVLAAALAEAAYALWWLAERLDKGAKDGRGVAGAPDA